jgi:hypothetical protein
MVFKATEWEGMDWINLAQDRGKWGGGAVVNMVMVKRIEN